MEQLIAQLVGVFAPLIVTIVKDHRAVHGVDPTPEEVQATFVANVSKYLGEGSAWRATHPNA